MKKDTKIIIFSKERKKENVTGDCLKLNSKHLNVDYGSVSINGEYTVYTNKYFGFSIRVPRVWHSMGYKDMFKLAERNIRKLEIDEEKIEKMLEAMVDNLNLFRASPHPERMAEENDNPCITCSAQRVSMYPSRKAKDFLQEMKEDLVSGHLGIKYTIERDIHPVILGGERFDLIELSATYNNAKVYSRYFASIIKGYQLVILASCITEEGMHTLDEILNSIKFHEI